MKDKDALASASSSTMYRQLYGLGCRIDGINYAIARLTRPHKR
jgi:hypothetical protein